MILYSWLVNQGRNWQNEEGFAALLQRDGGLTAGVALFDTDQTIRNSDYESRHLFT